MALPPTIPTSFVPRPNSSAVRHRSDLTGAFAFIGYGALSLMVALAIGVFVYSQILATEQENKDAELARRVAQIDPQTVAKFVQLRDRLSYGLTLLNKHPAFTGFWSALALSMPTGVRFDSLDITTDESEQVTLEGAGIAESFNALAATSDAFATDGRIKDAIFADIRVTGNAVSFSLSATIDPTLIAFSAMALPASTTPSTTP
ncbi:MAG TPA: hypothetical protein VJK73_00520 [Candidatus Paceibacterota bacterium]